MFIASRLIARSDVISEFSTEYNAADEYVYRDAEYEYEHEEDKEPEPTDAHRALECLLGNGPLTPRSG